MKIIYFVICAAVITTSCQESSETTAVTVPLKSDTTFVVKPELPVKDSQITEESVPEKKVTATSKKTSTKSKTTVNTQNESSNNNTAAADNNATQDGSASTETAQKKGWSKTAKGAVIGGVVGAGTGAIVNKKNRAAGAVIGGVIGAGAGAVIGHQMDKKDGRH